MKLYLDNKKTLGELVYVGAMEWLDYTTKEPKGTTISVMSLELMEKIQVKIKDVKPSQFSTITKGDKIELEGLVVNFYTLKSGKSGLSYSATKVKKAGR